MWTPAGRGVYQPGEVQKAMSAPSDNLPPDDPLRDRAVSWHVRLASDAADEADWLAFEAWLAESPDHGRAYEAVEQVWADLEAPPLAAATNVVPLRPRKGRPSLAWLGAIAASLVAAVLLGVTFLANNPTTQSYDTAIGQRQVIALSDGSHITLNGGSHIEATIGRRERRVVMADAEAVFDVAKDPARPFFIQAGDREIRVVGTEFNVLHHDGDVQVTVRRGVVEVRPAGRPTAAPLARLRKGQSLSHKEGRAGDVVGPADPDAAFAWTEGRLVFKGQRLADVAVTLNRYLKTPIQVAPDAQNLPVTATLNLGAEDDMLRSLAAFLPVHVERRPDSVRLSLRR